MNKGYLIPVEPEPVEDACMVVFYPDDPLYRRALVGSLLSLGTWGVWEKDALKRGILASNRWKLANLKTLNQRFDCDILEELDEDGKMTINVNVNCGCGCGGGVSGDIIVNVGPDGGTVNIPPGATTSYNPYEDEPPDIGGGYLDPSEPIPTTLEDAGHAGWGSYDVYMCDFASFLPDLIGRWLRGLESFTDRLATLAGAASLIAYLFPSWFAIEAGLAAFWDLVQAAIEIVLGENAADNLVELAEEIESEPLRSQITCLVFSNRYALPTAHSSVLNAISQRMVTLAWNGDLIEKLDRFMSKVLPLKWFMYESVHEIYAPMPVGADCSGCDGYEPPTGSIAVFTFDLDNDGWQHTPYQYSGWLNAGGDGVLVFTEGQWGNIVQWAKWNIIGAQIPDVAQAFLTRVDVTIGKNFSDNGPFLQMVVDSEGLADGPVSHAVSGVSIPYNGSSEYTWNVGSVRVPVGTNSPVFVLYGVGVSTPGNIFVSQVKLYFDVT